jgi:hypothetical protein
MILFWKVRYLDGADKQFKDRCLILHTKTLDPVTRAGIELVVQSKSPKTERNIVKYRHLFVEDAPPKRAAAVRILESFQFVGPSEYFEDETGREITDDEMGQILTGSPTAKLIPSGAKQHDIDFMLAATQPIPIAEVQLDAEEIRLFGYFVRDLQEAKDSAFMKDGPGTLKTSELGLLSPSSTPTLVTAANDEEIRSFVMIFRRLYMTGRHDPASFSKIIPIFTKALGNHPRSKWVEGVAKEYKKHLDSIPDFRPLIRSGTCTFTTKRLIDVFLYTQYAHQPNDERERQFGECLQEVHGKRVVLTWMFLVEMWKCYLEIGNAGRVIAWWFNRYCEHHGISPDVLNSLRDDHTGLGVVEKEADRQARMFREKTDEIAMELWKASGSPVGGHSQFVSTASRQLTQRLK